MRLLRSGLAALTLFGAACSCNPPRDGAIKVTVTAEGFSPRCIELEASDAEAPGSAAVSAQVPITGSAAGRTFTFAVYRKAEWSHFVALQVSAREKSCAGAVVASASEARIEVPADSVVEKSYTLRATDGDGDGYVLKAGAIGSDCNDMNAAVHPGAPELCGDSLDNDCSGASDCDDPACSGSSCDDGNSCTINDACGPGTCAGIPVVCNTPPGACRALTGSCLNGGCDYPLADAGSPCDGGMVCRNDGVCVPANTEFDCGDGVDNDGDGPIDCADSDCASVLCNAGLCTVGATCQGTSCTGGGPKPCAPPANGCLDAGVCNPSNGSCTYANVSLGTTCNDNNPCTLTDVCNAGTCVGAPMDCSDGGACGISPGACDAGSCVFTAAVGRICDDNASCTFGDVCTAGFTCMGTTYTCTTPPECRRSAGAQCLGDGGCNYPPDNSVNGNPCDGGVCNSGVCAPLDAGFVWPYTPSNYDPSTTPPGGAVVINCAVTFNSTDAGVSPSWCGGPAPGVFFITQSGSSEPAIVLSMSGLTFTDAGVLKLIGARPVILSVASAARIDIDGFIDARGQATTAGAGGNRASCGAQIGIDGGWNGNMGQSRGSGGGGAGFAWRGGDGGHNQDVQNGGQGGAPGPADLRPLVGGCKGGEGGWGDSAGGNGGAGGGAVQISTAGALRIAPSARISVSAGGGRGGNNSQRCGGGGGGSAGGIQLEANKLTVTNGARITSNGGAGGEGADADEPGANGENGSESASTPALGGTGLSSVGGAGGPGGAGSAGPGNGVNDVVGGGAGGSVGRIFVRAAGPGASCSTDGGAVFSPPPQNGGGCP